MLDTEIMPWSAKASGLIASQYEPVARSGAAGLSAALTAARQASARGVPVDAFAERLARRLDRVQRYAKAWEPYTWPVSGIDDLKIAPFHVLASENAVHFDKDHDWHMGIAARVIATGLTSLAPTDWRRVDLNDPAACSDAMSWWDRITSRGGEGMVVKPLAFTPRGSKGLIQAALKVRGPEYLRIIYGPEYDLPDNLVRLRARSLGGKRTLALREFALGHESLSRFVEGAPLRRVHECVFAVLALESEPVDPRL